MFCDVDGGVEMRSKQKFSWLRGEEQNRRTVSHRSTEPQRHSGLEDSGCATVLQGADAACHDMAGFVDSVHPLVHTASRVSGGGHEQIEQSTEYHGKQDERQ